MVLEIRKELSAALHLRVGGRLRIRSLQILCALAIVAIPTYVSAGDEKAFQASL